MLDDRSAASDESEDYDDDRDHEEYVNQTADNWKDEPAKQPENEKNYRNCPEHLDCLGRMNC